MGAHDRARSGPQRPQDLPVWAGSLTNIRTAAPQVVLTFDDGPQPGGTEQVLGPLAETGSTATFFVLVSRARRFPSLLAEVVAAGHEIGLSNTHGYDPSPSSEVTTSSSQRPDARAQRCDLKYPREITTGRTFYESAESI